MLPPVQKLLEAFARPREDTPTTLDTVLADERAEIAASRARRYAPDSEPSGNVHDTYVGIALSGGGIRSATVSLGILQGLNALGILKVVDYLSTVSGGGFIGGWWTAWMSRKHHGRLFPPNEELEPNRAPDFTKGESPPDGSRFAGRDPIHHLRLFANYITPRKGLLSSDSWRAAAVFSRNLVLTWLVLLPILCAVVLLGQLYYVVQPFDVGVVKSFVHYEETRGGDMPDVQDRDFHSLDGDILWPRALTAARPLVVLLVLMVIVTGVWMGLNNAGNWATRMAIVVALLVIAAAGLLAWNPELGGGQPQSATQVWQLLPFWDWMMVALTVLLAVWIVRDVHRPAGDGAAVTKQTRAGRATIWHTRLLTMFMLAGLTLAFAGFAHEFLIDIVFNLKDFNLETWKEKLAVVTGAASAITTVYSIFVSAPAGGRDRREVKPPSLASRIILFLAPPLTLVVLAAAAALAMHWVMFDVLFYEKRVAWLRLAAWASLALATFLAWWENSQIKGMTSTVPRVFFVAVTTLLVGGLLRGLAHYVMLPGPLDGWLGWSAGDMPMVRTLALLGGMVLSLLLLVGLLLLPSRSTRVRALLAFVSAFLLAWLLTLWLTGPGDPRGESLRVALCVLGGFAGWILALGWVADPNALSLHTFYKARLVRAYLGASNPAREHHEISEPSSTDDLRLTEVTSSRLGGPYHLVNTTLNLIGGRDLVTAQRWSANYVLAARHCGSTRTGFRPTAEYMNGQLTLGAAVAASGAAVSPNMGAATPSAALALLLGAFNIRLGLWVPTPGKASWMLSQMWLWPYYLLRESLSQTNDVGTHCYLTDGGHFDNTGLYALVERGCRYIIIADNGADPEPCFADIGEAIRRCRVDFRAEIELDTTPFRPPDDDKMGTTHVVYGRITYDAEHMARLKWPVDADPTGYLIWIKPAVLPNDSADVRQYKLENRSFPQQTTADQWFGESQFESYRKLGELSARAAFAGADTERLASGRLTTQGVADLFETLCERPRNGVSLALENGAAWWRRVAAWVLNPAASPSGPTLPR